MRLSSPVAPPRIFDLAVFGRVLTTRSFGTPYAEQTRAEMVAAYEQHNAVVRADARALSRRRGIEHRPHLRAEESIIGLRPNRKSRVLEPYRARLQKTSERTSEGIAVVVYERELTAEEPEGRLLGPHHCAGRRPDRKDVFLCPGRGRVREERKERKNRIWLAEHEEGL